MLKIGVLYYKQPGEYITKIIANKKKERQKNFKLPCYANFIQLAKNADREE